MANQHQWVEFQYLPITVEVDESTGDITTLIEEGAAQVASENAMHGCWFCHVPLNTETVETECPGHDEDELRQK